MNLQDSKRLNEMADAVERIEKLHLARIAELEAERGPLLAGFNAARQAQDILADYIVPDSGVSDFDCVNQLLGVLDRQDLVRTMRLRAQPKETGNG